MKIEWSLFLSARFQSINWRGSHFAQIEFLLFPENKAQKEKESGEKKLNGKRKKGKCAKSESDMTKYERRK